MEAFAKYICGNLWQVGGLYARGVFWRFRCSWCRLQLWAWWKLMTCLTVKNMLTIRRICQWATVNKNKDSSKQVNCFSSPYLWNSDHLVGLVELWHRCGIFLGPSIHKQFPSFLWYLLHSNYRLRTQMIIFNNIISEI